MTNAAPDDIEPSPPETSSVAPEVGGSGIGIGAALRTVASVTTISRLTGLARDAVCSRIFGAGPIWSAFAFAFLLPNLFRRLFGEGALSAAFLPEYARLADQDSNAARSYSGAMARWLLLGLGGATILGELILIALVSLGAGDHGGLALRLAMIMLPFMPLVCMTAIFGAMLQCQNRFGLPAAAPILVNVFIVGAAVIWTFGLQAPPLRTIYVVSVGVLVAGFIQLIWSLAALRENRPHLLRSTDPTVRPALRRTLLRMAPVAIGMSAMQINTLLDGLIASWPILVGPRIGLPLMSATVAYPLDEASNSILFFGQRLYHFPLGVFGIALATAVFPALSRAVRHDDLFSQTLRRGVRLSIFIGLPASIGLALVRDPLVFVIYRGGEFTDAAGDRVADVLLGYALGVWAFGLTHVLTRGFYARGDTRTPMRISLVFIAANLTLNLVGIWMLREAALAWSTTVCAIGQCIALFWLCRRRLGQSAIDGDSAVSMVKIAGASLGMAAAVFVVQAIAPAPETWGGQFLLLGGMVSVGAATFVGLASLLRLQEMKWILSKD